MRNPHAVALGQLGGEARARTTTSAQRKEWARLGGEALASRHSKAQISKWGKLGGRPPDKGKKGKR